MHQLDDEFGAHGADDRGEQRAARKPEKDRYLAPAIVEAIDQDVDPDMDADTYAIGRAELRHPDEHVNAKFLRPGEVDSEQVGIEPGNIDEKAMNHRDEGDHGRRAHQARDDDLLEPVENFQKHQLPL